MQKLVNGKLVDIGDIRLFEAAFLGLVLNKRAISNINTTIEKESEMVKRCIDAYNSIYRRLPFPIYCIENNAKYAAIAECMKLTDKTVAKYRMCVSKALYIEVDKGKVLKLLGNTWGIESIRTNFVENAKLSNFVGDIGYAEYKWVLGKIKENKGIEKYYKENMADIIAACNNDNNILRNELANILNFKPVPQKINLNENIIVDKVTGDVYRMDIYLVGKVANNHKIQTFSFKNENNDIKYTDEYLPTYGYKLYKKSIIEDEMLNESIYYGEQVEVDDRDAFDSIFETIIRLGIKDNDVMSTVVSGIICDDCIIYQIGNKIFKCSNKEYTRSVEVVQGVEIYSFRDNKLYLRRLVTDVSKISKETIYSMNIDNGELEICRIRYM